MEKTLIDFLNKYFGQPNVGNTSENRGQCVGLIELWLNILGLSQIWGNAKDLIKNASSDRFTITYNNFDDYNQFPKPGDILVFGPSFGGGYGHCGVVLRANGYSFSLFDQNNPVGARPTITNYHNYAGVLGWISPK